MKPYELRLTRKFNLGNYQTVDISVSAKIDENEDPKQAIKDLEKLINDYWNDRTENLISKTKPQP
jgi:uncharacterized protein YggL (DUF469 family)